MKKAMRCLTPGKLADLESELVRDAILRLYPSRDDSHAIPDMPDNSPHILTLTSDEMGEVLVPLVGKFISPGLSGWRAEYLRTVLVFGEIRCCTITCHQ